MEDRRRSAVGPSKKQDANGKNDSYDMFRLEANRAKTSIEQMQGLMCGDPTNELGLACLS